MSNNTPITPIPFLLPPRLPLTIPTIPAQKSVVNTLITLIQEKKLNEAQELFALQQPLENHPSFTSDSSLNTLFQEALHANLSTITNAIYPYFNFISWDIGKAETQSILYFGLEKEFPLENSDAEEAFKKNFTCIIEKQPLWWKALWTGETSFKDVKTIKIINLLFACEKQNEATEFLQKVYAILPLSDWGKIETPTLSQLFCHIGFYRSQYPERINEFDPILTTLYPHVNPLYEDHCNSSSDEYPITALSVAILCKREEIIENFSERNADFFTAVEIDGIVRSHFSLLYNKVGSPFCTKLVNTFTVSQKKTFDTLSSLIEQIPEEDDIEPIALLFLDAICTKNPDWWQTPGIKESIFRDASWFKSKAIALRLAPFIDVNTEETSQSTPSPKAPPLILTAQNGWTDIVELLIKRKTNLSYIYQGKTACEWIVDYCGSNAALVQNVLNNCPIEELRSFRTVIEALQSKKPEEAAVALKTELTKREPAKWATDKKKLSCIYTIAAHNDAKNVATLVRNKMEISASTIIAAIENNWVTEGLLWIEQLSQPHSSIKIAELFEAVTAEQCINRTALARLAAIMPIDNENLITSTIISLLLKTNAKEALSIVCKRLFTSMTSFDFLGNNAVHIVTALVQHLCAEKPSWWQHGQDIQTTLLFWAIHHRDTELATVILTKGVVPAKAYEDLIYAAAEASMDEVVHLLMLKGASLTKKSGSKDSPLSLIIQLRSSRFVEKICREWFVNFGSSNSLEGCLILSTLFDKGWEQLGNDLFWCAYTHSPRPTWFSTQSNELSQLFCDVCSSKLNALLQKEIATVLCNYVDPNFEDAHVVDEPLLINYVIDMKLEEILVSWCRNGTIALFTENDDEETPFSRIFNSDNLGKECTKKLLNNWNIEHESTALALEYLVDPQFNNITHDFYAKILKAFTTGIPILTSISGGRELVSLTTPPWMTRPGCKESLFLGAAFSKNKFLALALAPMIDVNFKDSKQTCVDSNNPTPVIAAAQNQWKDVVEILVGRKADLTATYTLTEYGVSQTMTGFEYLEEQFRDDSKFVIAFLEECPLQWLREYTDLLTSLRTSQNNTETYALLKAALESKTPSKWTEDPNRLSSIFVSAIKKGYNNVASLVINKMAITKEALIATLATNYKEFALMLFQKAPQRVLREFFYENHINPLTQEIIEQFPAEQQNALCILNFVGRKPENSPLFIRLAKRLLPIYTTKEQRQQILANAIVCDAQEIAEEICTTLDFVADPFAYVRIIQGGCVVSEPFLDLAINKKWKNAIVALAQHGGALHIAFGKISEAFSDHDVDQILKASATAFGSFPNEHIFKLLTTLLEKKLYNKAKIVCSNLVHALAKYGTHVSVQTPLEECEHSPTHYTTQLLETIIPYNEFKAHIIELVTLGASLSSITNSESSLLQKIETQYGEKFALELIQNAPIEEVLLSRSLLFHVIITKKSTYADALFARIIDPKAGPQWAKTRSGATDLFFTITSASDGPKALQLVDSIDPKKASLPVFNSQIPLMLACCVTQEEPWLTIVKKLLPKSDLTYVEKTGRSAFSFLNTMFPALAKNAIATYDLNTDATVLFETLIRENYIEYAHALWERILNHQSLGTFIKTLPITTPKIPALLHSLLQHQRYTEAELLYTRIAEDFAKSSPNDTPTQAKAIILETVIQYPEWKDKVVQLVDYGADLSFSASTTHPSLVMQIEKTFGIEFTLSLLERYPLEDKNQAISLISGLLQRKLYAEPLFKRLSLKWLNNTHNLTELFFAFAFSSGNSIMALRLVDDIDPHQVSTTHKTPLMVASSSLYEPWPSIAALLLPRSSMTQVDAAGISTFHYVNMWNPRLARDYIASCTINDEIVPLFETLVREHFENDVHTLWLRIQKHKSLPFFLKTIAIDNPKIPVLLHCLLEAKQYAEAEILYTRILKNFGTCLTAPNNTTIILEIFANASKETIENVPSLKNTILDLVSYGADLSFCPTDTIPSLFQKIAQAHGTPFAIEMLKKIPLENELSILSLFSNLLKITSKEYAKAFLNHISKKWTVFNNRLGSLLKIACSPDASAIDLLIKQPEWKENIVTLVTSGTIDLTLMCGNRCLWDKIATILSQKELLKIIQEIPIEDATCFLLQNKLLRHLLRTDEILAEELFKRMSNSTESHQPYTATELFFSIIHHGKLAWALDLVDRVDVNITDSIESNVHKTVLMLACEQKKTAQLVTLIRRILAKKPSLIAVDAAGRSAFSYLISAYPAMAQECLSRYIHHTDAPLFFDLLVREKRHQLLPQFLEQLVTAPGLAKFLETVPLTFINSFLILRILLPHVTAIKKPFQAFCNRFMQSLNTPSNHPKLPTGFIDYLLEAFISAQNEYPEQEEAFARASERHIFTLIKMGAALVGSEPLTKIDPLTKIEELFQFNGLLRALKETPLEGVTYSITLLCTLLNKKKHSAAQLLYERMLDPTTGPSWTKNSNNLSLLFFNLINRDESTLALRLIPSLDLSIKCIYKGKSMTALMAACSNSTDPKWHTLVEVLMLQNPSLTDIDSSGVSAFSYLHTAFPDIAARVITTGSLVSDQTALFSTLIRENYTAYATELFNRLEKENALFKFLQALPVENQSTLFVLNTLLEKKKFTEFNSLYSRIAQALSTKDKEQDTPISFKAQLAATLLKHPDQKEQVFALIAMGADLAYRGEDNKSLMQKIEETFDASDALIAIQKKSLFDVPQTLLLVQDLIIRNKREQLQTLFTRLTDKTTSDSWIKHPIFLSQLFFIVTLFKESDLATALVDIIDVTQPCAINSATLGERTLTPLMLVSTISNAPAWRNVVEKLLARKASITASDSLGQSAFTYIHQMFPDIAARLITEVSLAQDQSTLFSILIHNKNDDLFLQLFSRLQSIQPAPRWWSPYVRADFFFKLAPCAKYQPIFKEVAEILLTDPAVALTTRNQSEQSVLMVALEYEFPRSCIQALLERSDDTELLKYDINGKSAFSYLISKPQTIALTHPILKSFFKRLSINPTNYDSLQELVSVDTINSTLENRIMRALLINDKKCLIAILSTLSFAKKYTLIEEITSKEKLTDIYKDVLLNHAFTINEKHYTISSPEVPIPKTTTTLNDLVVLYTTYIKPASATPSIQMFINKIKDQYVLAAPTSVGERAAFYKNIENQIIFVIDYFKNEISKFTPLYGENLPIAALQSPPVKLFLTELKNYLKETAAVSKFCGVRLQDHARSYYMKYILKQSYDFKRRLLYDLADFRTTIVQQGLPANAQSVHAFNGFLKQYANLGLPGTEEAKKYTDVFIKGHELEIEQAHFHFTKTYTPANIINFIRAALNDSNYYKLFNEFLEKSHSEEISQIENHIHTLLCNKVQEIQKTTTKGDKEKKEEIEALLTEPWNFEFDEADIQDVATLRLALQKPQNHNRLLYAISKEFINKTDNIFQYTWVSIALVLKAMRILL